jgi:benzoate membrane transport protein
VQAGLLAFIITTADFSLWGVSSAFWGVIVGVAAVHLTRMANYVAKR